MYNCTLVPYSQKSKYQSYHVPFEYRLAFKMATKAMSTRLGRLLQHVDLAEYGYV